MKIFTVSENCTLKFFTDTRYPQGSFVFSLLLKKRDIKVNGARVGKDVALVAGDTVVYYTTPKEESAPSHLTVYEDENIVVCDKFSGVTSEGLLSELREKGERFAVHRLDRNTQGLIVFAKTAKAEGELLRAFRERRAEKTYLALCKDGFHQEKDVLRAYLVKDAENALVRVYDRPIRGGVEIVTEYRILKRGNGLALVEITLHTGKTHQIRAHMAHIGCPVLGDEKYGDGELNKRYGARRQRLVSKRLVLRCGGELSDLDGRVFESSFSPEL